VNFDCGFAALREKQSRGFNNLNIKKREQWMGLDICRQEVPVTAQYNETDEYA
jgi:hypothetical protein